MATKDPSQELAVQLAERQAQTEWITVGLHGHEMADRQAGQGVQLHGSLMRGHKELAKKRQAEWPRGRGGQEQQEEQQVQGRLSIQHSQAHAGGAISRMEDAPNRNIYGAAAC